MPFDFYFAFGVDLHRLDGRRDVPRAGGQGSDDLLPEGKVLLRVLRQGLQVVLDVRERDSLELGNNLFPTDLAVLPPLPFKF